ncbi:MAG: hypothetical protein ABJD07_03990 [Gemmatimonadaceae bacterium]
MTDRKKKGTGGTEAGSEATRGIRAASGNEASGNAEGNRAGEGQGPARSTPTPSRQGDGDESRTGSESVEGTTRQHESGYGGHGGEPKTSSDQRE